MAVKIFDNKFINCGTGVSAPADMELEMGGNSFDGCKRAIELRDTPTLLQSLGIRESAPPELVRELLEAVRTADSSAAIAHQVQRSELRNWLASGANTATLTTALVQLWQSNLVQASIRTLFG